MLVGSLLVCDHTNRRPEISVCTKWQGRNPEKQQKTWSKAPGFWGVDGLEGGLIKRKL